MINPILNASGSALPAIGAAQFSFAPKTSASQIVRMLDNIGARIVRIDVPWADTELAPGVYAIPPYVDGIIAAAQASGRQVVLVLGYGNPLYPGSGAWNLPPRDAASCNAYGNYGAFVSATYPTAIIEVFNEWNNPTYWAGAPDPVQAAALLTACVTKILAKNPAAQIMTAGVGPVAAPNDQNPFMNALATAAGPTIMGRMTAHAIHPYDASHPPEALFDFIDAYRAAVPYTSGPIAVTEWGYTNAWIGTDDTKRAIYVARMIGCAVVAGVKLLTIFGLHDTGADPNNIEYTFGLHKFDGMPKPAVAAMRAMMDALAGTVTYDAEQIGNVYRIALRKANGAVTKIVWTEATTSVNWVEPMAAPPHVVDTAGFRTWHRVMPDSSVQLTLGPTVPPVIITGT
ncbi:hypothetical protein [Bradyrhizobium sp. URHD0069]|uniref:hypothetical protein n=1 Tax=Bradyrhizobium sp. URHD0069 TaxID=1380355 RepID=UPI000495C93B|nr:hypothetical protein [Bradyrhizobium sp. URHD0069]